MAGLRLEIIVDDKGSATIKKVEGAHESLERKVVGGSAKMSRAAEGLKRKWQGLGQTLQRAAQIGKIALTGLAIAAVVTGAKFEQSMANTGAILGKTRQEMTQLTAVARGLGATTVFSASQASEAMYSLASAGQNMNQIMASSPAVLLYAGAAATNLGDAAETLVQTLAQFNLAAEESNRVVNVFAAAISGSLLNSERLREGLAQVGSVAASTGLQLEETVAVLGMLNTAGQVGGIAGTRLKNVLVRLASPNEALIGILGDVSLKTDGLTGAMEKLKDADPGEIFKAFGRIAAPAVLALRNQTGALKELQAQITDTQKAQEMFNIQMDTVAAQFKIFKSQLQENMIATFYALRDAGFDLFGALTAGLAALKPIIVGLTATVVEWVSENREALKTLAKITAVVLGAVAAWALLTNPITWVTAAIVALTTIWTRWGDTIKTKTTEVYNRVLEFASGFIEANESAIGSVAGFFRGFFNFLIGSWVASAKNWAVIGRTLWTSLKGPLEWVWDKVKWLGEKVATLFSWLGKTVAGTFEDITADLEGPAEESSTVFGKMLNEMRENARQAYAVDYVGAVSDGLGAGLAIAKEKLGQLKDAASDAAEDIVAKGKMIGGAVVAPGAVEGGSTAGAQEEATKVAEREAIKRAQAEIAAGMKAEDARRAQLVRTIAEDEANTKAWLDAKLNLLKANYEEDVAANADSEEKKAELKAEYAASVAEAEMEHRQAVIDHFVETNDMAILAIRSLEAAYDTFWRHLARGEIKMSELRKRISESIKETFIMNTGRMIKFWISAQLKALLITNAAKEKSWMKERFEDAKSGARKAFSAFASIPVIGPVLGAVAAAAAFAFLMAFQRGGRVPGISQGRDSVPAILEPEEYIINRTAARAIGEGNLEYMNRTGALPPGVSASTGATTRGDINLYLPQPANAREASDIMEYLEDEVVPRLEDIRARRRGLR